MHFSFKQTILLCIKDKELQSVISILLLLVHGLSFFASHWFSALMVNRSVKKWNVLWQS
jgi:hypothetical protein